MDSFAKYKEAVREAVTVHKDNGGYYLLSDEQFAALESAARELVIAELEKMRDEWGYGETHHPKDGKGDWTGCMDWEDWIEMRIAVLKGESE